MPEIKRRGAESAEIAERQGGESGSPRALPGPGSLRALRSLHLFAVLLLDLLFSVGAGCGPKGPQGNWIEHEELGRTHSRPGAGGRSAATPGTPGAPKAATIDLAKLDAATIDELDLATCTAVID